MCIRDSPGNISTLLSTVSLLLMAGLSYYGYNVYNKIKKIFHYARFDLAAIYKNMGIMCENIYCTKIASKLVRTYTDKHGLKELCKELINVDISKQKQSSDWGNNKLSHEQLVYAASDVLYLHKIKHELDIILERENRIDLYKDCLKFLQTRVNLDLALFKDDIWSH